MFFLINILNFKKKIFCPKKIIYSEKNNVKIPVICEKKYIFQNCLLSRCLFPHCKSRCLGNKIMLVKERCIIKGIKPLRAFFEASGMHPEPASVEKKMTESEGGFCDGLAKRQQQLHPIPKKVRSRIVQCLWSSTNVLEPSGNIQKAWFLENPEKVPNDTTMLRFLAWCDSIGLLKFLGALAQKPSQVQHFRKKTL